MKKKFLIVISLLLATFFFGISNVKADIQEGVKVNQDGSYTLIDKSKKTPVVVNGKTLYGYAKIFVDTDYKKSVFVTNPDITYDQFEERFYFNIKRSELNNIVKKYAPNGSIVINQLNVYLDYYDATSNDVYFIANGDLNKINVDLSDGFAEGVLSSYISLVNNVKTSKDGYQYTMSGHTYNGRLIYIPNAADKYTNASYKENEIDTSSAILNFQNYEFITNIIEDERVDFGNNVSKVVTDSTDENGNEKTEEVDVDNFYAKYDEAKKMLYSWTMYDENGEATTIDFDTDIKFDESEYEKDIMNYFDNGSKENMMFLSFKHHGNLKGKAKVGLYVGNKFKPKDKLKFYYYNENSKQIEDVYNKNNNGKDYIYEVVDDEGYVNIELDHCSEYVLVKEDVKLTSNEKLISSNTTGNKFDIRLVILGCGIVIVSILIVIIILGKIKNKKKINKEEIPTNNEENNQNMEN